jgi:secreted trypsin-like serine protease
MIKLLILISFFVSTLTLESLPSPFIVGGNNATRGQFKYFGSLRYRLGAVEVHQCGASILNTRWSLTAAHCFDFDLSIIDGVDMVVGSVSLSDPGTRYNIVEIVKHPAYLSLDLSSIGINWILNE